MGHLSHVEMPVAVASAYGVRDDPAEHLFAVNTVAGRVRYGLDRVLLVDEIQDAASGYYRWDPETAVHLPPAGA